MQKKISEQKHAKSEWKHRTFNLNTQKSYNLLLIILINSRNFLSKFSF